MGAPAAVTIRALQLSEYTRLINEPYILHVRTAGIYILYDACTFIEPGSSMGA